MVYCPLYYSCKPIAKHLKMQVSQYGLLEILSSNTALNEVQLTDVFLNEIFK